MILMPEYYVKTEMDRRMEQAHGAVRRRTVRRRLRVRETGARSEHPTA
ncbi:hypothetical protein KV100_15495 [Mumia sp. zg.B21]|nr:hypothetical protein [Mumia sp. zg.B21]MBW9211062.1 hypothetical protein [Mumia sp. zg.B21]